MSDWILFCLRHFSQPVCDDRSEGSRTKQRIRYKRLRERKKERRAARCSLTK